MPDPNATSKAARTPAAQTLSTRTSDARTAGSRATGSRTTGAPSLAVVGLACRFPDADDPAALLDVVLTGRRSFRRLPAGRINLTDYYQADRTVADATYSARAAVLEGWQFEPEAFDIDPAVYLAADPAHWLALETTARALAAAGLPAGHGLDLDRTGVIIGNTLNGDTSRANALRVRWPFVRRLLTNALDTQEVPANQAGRVLRTAEISYLAPFPAMGPASLAGSMPATIANAISAYFGFRGGSHAVDSACSSSLQAVASACAALTAGELDAAVAGGVDLSLDPLELIGLAKAGVLATTDVRIYDREPTGYLPGEGCGIVVLMRTSDARAAELPIFAEILGWGTSAGSVRSAIESQASAQLLAMQRAYDRAAVDPADIQFIEGNGAATATGDAAELSALCTLRQDARQRAAIGSVKANIGHAKAAAGAAGLIKTVLALGTGVVPPTTGVHEPHELIASGDAGLVLPQSPAEWPSGNRLAAVSTMGIGGSNVHLVLRHQQGSRPRQDRWLRSMPSLAKGTPKQSTEGVQPRLQPEPEPTPFLLHARDKFALVSVLTRLADVAGLLSDAEFQDLACTLGRDSGKQGQSRVGIVATRQDQLASLARQATGLLPHLADGLITVRPGIFASDNADGRVTLLLSGDASAYGGDVHDAQLGPVALTSGVSHCLDTLRWLDSLEVRAACAVGHGVGALAGLAWAGVLSEAEVVEIADLRTQYLLRAAERAESSGEAMLVGQVDALGTGSSGAAGLRAAIAQRFRFGPPRRRLISTMTGAELDSVDDAIDLICTGFARARRLTDAVRAGAIGATLLVETGPGRILVSAASRVAKVPAISLQSGFTDSANRSGVAAALFVAGALELPKPLFAGRPARPIDIWREPVFITSPCEVAPDAHVDAAHAGTSQTSVADEPVAAPADSAGHAETSVVDEPVPAAADSVAHAETSVVDEPIPAAADSVGQPESVAADKLALADAEAAAPDEQVAAVTDEAADKEDGDAEGGEISVADEPAPAVTSEPAILRKPVVRGVPRVAGEAKHPARMAAQRPAPQPPVPRAPHELAVSRGKARPPVDGLGPWARCFTEGLRPVSVQPLPAAPGSWRLHAATSNPVLTDVSSVFTSDPAAGQTLVILDDPDDERSRGAALNAAKDAIETGKLVVVTTSARFTGFFASMQAEHRATGVTVIRVPAGGVTNDAIRNYASVEEGPFHEIVLDNAGVASEPVLAEVTLKSGGDPALGPDDLILISRSAAGASLALAQVLARCGAGVAIVGRAGEYDDSELIAGLEKLRSAGARIGYEVIEIGDKPSLAAAIRRIEERLGKVTALAYGASTDNPAPVTELTDTRIQTDIGDEIGTLELLAGSIRAGQLKLIISVGRVADRYGLATSSMHALCTGALASRAAQLAAASVDCQHLHLDLPGWTSDLGDRPELAIELTSADAPLLDVNVVSRLLLKLLKTPGIPDSVALHGRVGGLPALPAQSITQAELSAAGMTYGARFLREVEVHYPGVELVCSAALSLASDPYLADYRIDGMPVLPPVLAIEALAQAASVLGGRPLRRATNVRLDSPVLIPARGEAMLRVVALRNGNRVVAALRCADSSYRVDHARAEFNCAPSLPGLPEMPDAAFGAASPALQQLATGAADLVDGAELYGPIAFQSGRFRRIALLPEVTARSGRALARGADDQAWYPAGSDLGSTEFLLGSPGLNDATLQVLQACVPHRRVRPVACESVQFAGRVVDGPVEIRAIAEPVRWPNGSEAPDVADQAEAAERGPVPAPDFVMAPALVPSQAAAPDEETTSRSARAADDVSSSAAAAEESPRDMTPGELADPQVAEDRPPSWKSRKGRRSRRFRGVPFALSVSATIPEQRTWDGLVAAPRQVRRLATEPQTTVPQTTVPQTTVPQTRVPPATRSQVTGRRDGRAAAEHPVAFSGRQPRRPVVPAPTTSVPQSWSIEAIDAAGQLVATWRGVRLHDAGPLPRNAAWPPALLSVYLERCAIDLGLNEGLRVTVSCGEPEGPLPDSATAVPRQSLVEDARPPSRGRHAGPERRALSTVSAVGSGALAGFSLALRAPVPVACAWTLVEPGLRQHELSSPLAPAYADLRANIAESPAELSARLEAVGTCLAMADLVPEDHGARQLEVVRTTSDGWVLLQLGRAQIVCTVIEVSGVSAPIAIAILTRRYAHVRPSAGRAEAPVSTS